MAQLSPDDISMTVNLDWPRRAFWNSLQNWSASPAYDCEHVRPLPGSHHALAPPHGISELRRMTTRAGFGLTAVFAYRLSYAPGTLAPPRLQSVHPPTPKCSQCFKDTFPYWHGHTPSDECLRVHLWAGSTQPLCQKDTQVLQLFGVSWSPWCCCNPFAGSASSANSSVPPSATQG